MGEIKQLPQNVANQISAGEVVERPASIVKELIENSIDADAENIEIRIEDGGRKLIKVKDDGCGILAEDIEAAFSRYATSKINDIDDLYSLYSLGFRGEALASISSVAEVEMISRHQSEDAGIKIKIKGGDILNKKPAGAKVGTEVAVKELFYNTPARYKYLKTTTTEFSHISRIVSTEAAASSDISFKLFHNGRQILSTPGNGKLKDSIYAIFGEEIADNLLPIDIEDRYIKLSGYITRPELTRSSRSHELFFVNKRPIYNNITAKAVENAYKKLIDPGRKPIVFLFIKVNPILVDVNVHPTKRQVKFSRNQIIYDVISKGVRKTLKEADPTTRIKLEKNSEEKSEQSNKNKLNNFNKFNDNKISKNNISADKKEPENKNGSQNENLFKNNFNKKQSRDYKRNQFEEKSINVEDALNAGVSEDFNDKYLIKGSSASEKNFKFLGQIFNSYLVIETEEGLKIIDQHNAHERILFEKLTADFNKKNTDSQSLLIPVKVELSPEEREIVRQYKDVINEFGIEFSDFGGNTILIQEVPVILKNKSTRNIIEELIAELSEAGKGLTPAEVEKSMIEYLACRTAVKAGKPLNRKESIELIKDLYKTENPYRCPHSRPVMINISREEIEKGIGRK
ncbi:MAG: DNA mismatch repair endonuclease MutL [Halanaerobium sp.]